MVIVLPLITTFIGLLTLISTVIFIVREGRGAYMYKRDKSTYVGT